MELYSYQPIRSDEGEVRFLTLAPKSSGSLTITLWKATLNPSDPPEFDALSYVWGDSQSRADIQITEEGDDSSYTTVLSVTQALAEALPYLQLETRSRNLWIDAICINQDDLDERAAQVKRMVDIYSSAIRLEIWLGLATDDSDIVLSLCGEVGSRFALGSVERNPYSLIPHQMSANSLKFY